MQAGVEMSGVVSKAAAVVPFILCIIAANWLTASFGLIPVGFGLVATAGTYAAGLTFVFRDVIHEAGGRWLAVTAIATGAVLSWFVASPALAVASGVTFLVAELADLAVYVPLRERGLLMAVLVSNIVGFTLDTFLFLYLAGFPITPQVVAGQLVAKATMTAAGLGVLWLWQKRPVVGVA